MFLERQVTDVKDRKYFPFVSVEVREQSSLTFKTQNVDLNTTKGFWFKRDLMDKDETIVVNNAEFYLFVSTVGHVFSSSLLCLSLRCGA